jgi:hypothetical protein
MTLDFKPATFRGFRNVAEILAEFQAGRRDHQSL